MISTTLALATVAPVLAVLAILLAIVDHVRAPEVGDGWFIASLAAFVIAAIPFTPFGFEYDLADNAWGWRVATCAIVALPSLLLHVVGQLTGRGPRSVLVRIADVTAVALVITLLAMPTFPGPTYHSAPMYYVIAFGVFSALYVYCIATAVVLLAGASRRAHGPARVRGLLLLVAFILLGTVTASWLLVPIQAAELWWSLCMFVSSMPFWFGIRAPKELFQVLARDERSDPADGIARLMRSGDVASDLPRALDSTLRAWGLHRVEVLGADGVIATTTFAANKPDDRTHRRVEIDGDPGGVRIVLHADPLSPTMRPHDRTMLTLLATSIQLSLDREDAAHHARTAKDDVARAAEAIHEADVRMRRADAANDRLLDAVTSDLRAPVASLLGLTRVAETPWEELPADQLPTLQHLVARRAEHVASTVEQLLLAASLADGTLLGGRSVVDMREVLAQSARDAGMDLADATRAPSETASCMVETDPLAVRHVLAILVENAQLHGAEPIAVCIDREEQAVRVEVSDHGPGIRPEFEPIMYDRFTRDSVGDVRGIGLGLAIASELAALVGATIGHRHDTGRTTFWLVVPAAQVAA